MALNADERDLLHEARALIERGEIKVICRALYHAEFVGPHTGGRRDALHRLTAYISNALGSPLETLRGWQIRRGMTGRDTRADRLAWIDWMIEEGKDE